MKIWSFKVGDFAIINEKALSGLPNDVGKLVEVSEYVTHGSYDYRVSLPNGEYTRVRDRELNKVNNDDIIMKIKVGDNIVRVNGDKVRIVLIDYLYRQVEVEYQDNTYEVIGVEKFIEKSDVVCQ